jgi:magnesium-transporting ATPase (P-type)
VIFDNLKKLIRYTMADNVAEMYCYWVYIILKIPLPMGTIGMLLSTLAADVFPAVALAYEGAENDIMLLKPRDPKKDRLMSGSMLSYSYGQVAVIETLAGSCNISVCMRNHHQNILLKESALNLNCVLFCRIFKLLCYISFKWMVTTRLAL